MVKKRRRITVLFNVPNNFLGIILPILLPRTLLTKKYHALLIKLFILRRLIRLTTIRLARTQVTNTTMLTLTMRPTSRPSTILNLVVRQSLRVSILYPVLLNRLRTLPPKIMFIPSRPSLIRLNLTFQHSTNTKVIQILPNMTLTNSPFTRRSTIQYSVVKKRFRVPRLLNMPLDNLRILLPLTSVPISPISTSNFRPLSLLRNRLTILVNTTLTTRPSTRHRTVQHGMLSKYFRVFIFRVVTNNYDMTLLPRIDKDIPRRTSTLRPLSTNTTRITTSMTLTIVSSPLTRNGTTTITMTRQRRRITIIITMLLHQNGNLFPNRLQTLLPTSIRLIRPNSTIYVRAAQLLPNPSLTLHFRPTTRKRTILNRVIVKRL